MAPKKPFTPKKPASKVDYRNLTPQERRELFLAGAKERKDDWRIIKKDVVPEQVPTNILAIDHGLKFNGLGRGYVYQIHGDEGSGKSTTTYCIVREYQRATGEPIAIFDFERTTTDLYLKTIGVDRDMAYVKRPDSIEDACKDLVNLISQGVRLFVFDSIPRMSNKVDIKDIRSGDAFKSSVGVHARAISRFYDVVLPYIAECDGILLMVNQTRSRIEASMDAKSAAKGFDTVTNLNYTLPGGRANRFNVAGMIELKLMKALKPGKAEDEWWLEADARHGEEYLCNVIRLRSLKDKVNGSGFRQSMMFIRAGVGVDDNISIRQMARSYGLIANHGKRWYVGNSVEDAIKVYDDKSAAYQALILDQDAKVLHDLKALVVKHIQSDDKQFKLALDASTAAYFTGEQEHEMDAYDPAVSEITTVDDDGI